MAIGSGRTAFTRSIGAVSVAILIGAGALVAGPFAGVAAADTPLTFTVNNPGNADDATPDGTCDTCTLREAVHEANTHPGTDIIHFDLVAPYRIQLTKALPQIKDPVIIDGSSLPGFDPGAGVMVRIDGNSGVTGITALLKIVPGGDGSTIRALDLVRAGAGVTITGDNNTVAGVYAGITPTGLSNCGTPCSMNDGVRIVDGSHNVIGGTNPADRNVLSNNTNSGVNILSQNGASVANVVEGNYLGINPAGTAARPNEWGFTQDGAATADTIVGGTAPGAGNVASGNIENGIIFQDGTGTIAGNIVGLRPTGDKPIPNQFGGMIVEELTDHVTVGGPTAASRNVVSGNDVFGILVEGEDGTNHTVMVQNNYVGTDVTGLVDRGNGGRGIDIALDSGTIVTGNVVSGNDGDNVRMAGCASCDPVLGVNQQLTDNIIGLDANGAKPLDNGGAGVFVDDGVGLLLARNTISGNHDEGIRIEVASNPLVFDNKVGTNAAATATKPNHKSGIAATQVTGGAIGASGHGNLISGNSDGANGADGISLAQSSGVTVQGNLVGTKSTGNGTLPNSGAGIDVSDSDQIDVGGGSDGEGNVVGGNGAGGVVLSNVDASFVTGNHIGAGASTTAVVGNDGAGVLVTGGSTANSIGMNFIANNTGAGIEVSSDSSGNHITANRIRANGQLGIDLGGDGVTANDVGDADTGANALQNFPVLTASTSTGGKTDISGTLNSNAGRQYAIEYFSSPSCDASGNGEGATYIGFDVVTTDGSGNATIASSLSRSVGNGQQITATATDATTGDTSEFSACITNNA